MHSNKVDSLGTRWIHWVQGGFTGYKVDSLGTRWIHWVQDGFIGYKVNLLGTRWIHLVQVGSTSYTFVESGTKGNSLQQEILTSPQNQQMYFPCCWISIFFIIFRSDAPYRVPYLPTTPTFFVRLAFKRNNNQQKHKILLHI